MAAKKRAKKVTHDEFLAWLEGVESMQDPDWTPSPAQWKTIRDKLNTVKPDVEVREIHMEHADTPTPSGQPVAQFVDQPSSFEQTRTVPPPRMQLSAHQQGAPAAPGVPAPNMGPHLDANGNLPAESEFL